MQTLDFLPFEMLDIVFLRACKSQDLTVDRGENTLPTIVESFDKDLIRIYKAYAKQVRKQTMPFRLLRKSSIAIDVKIGLAKLSELSNQSRLLIKQKSQEIMAILNDQEALCLEDQLGAGGKVSLPAPAGFPQEEEC